MDTITISNISCEVEWKSIKNIHLTVYPPEGRVHVSAPKRMSKENVRLFLLTKLPWLKAQLKDLSSVERQSSRQYVSGEDHYFMGQRYRLKLQLADAAPKVYIENNNFMVLQVRPGSDVERKAEVMYDWYRQQLRETLDKLIPMWEERMAVKSTGYKIQRMKTEWGSCNHRTRHLLFNSELAKKPLRCIEFIVVHELNHINHRLHDAMFVDDMNKFLPDWEKRKKELDDFII